MQHARRLPDPATSRGPDAPSGDATGLEELTAEATGLGREIVDIGAFLTDLDAQCRAQADALDHVRRNTEALADVSGAVSSAVDRVVSSADEALAHAETSGALISDAGRSSRAIAQWVHQVNADSGDVEEMLQGVQLSNMQVSDIAAQVSILAVNAKIEAARAGPAGQGFSIVADAVNDLSRKTAEAADRISDTVRRLSDWMARLQQGAEQNARGASEVLTGSERTDAALTEIRSHIGAIRQEAAGLSSDSHAADEAVTALRPAVDGIARSVKDVSGGVDEASSRCDSLVDSAESILQHTVELGGSGVDSPMITLVQDLARRVIEVFETALRTGKITRDALFDESYRPVPGTDPQQVTTRFTALTDMHLPAIQEAALGVDPRIVFCAAVDRNGYLPTHNRKFSQPQGDDPVWNAAHARNRRIFDDRVGLKAGRNTRPFLLQVYRRDMGGGTFVMMKDLSAPITVSGAHWGGLRLAYRF